MKVVSLCSVNQCCSARPSEERPICTSRCSPQAVLGRLVLSCHIVQCYLLQTLWFVPAWGYMVLPGQRREMMCSAECRDGSSACFGGSPHPFTKCIAELQQMLKNLSGAYCVYSLEYILPWRWELFTLWKVVSVPCSAFVNTEAGCVEELKGAFEEIGKAIKILILSLRCIKYSDQT